MADIFLALGSNIEDRFKNIDKGLELINAHPHMWILNKSNIYSSSAMYNTKQNDFYNMVIEIETNLTPLELLKVNKNIEKLLGREISKQRYQPRTLDIDILSYNEIVINTKILTIPHEKICERKFVLKPWNDIAPNYKLPNNNKTIYQLLNDIKDDSKIRMLLI